MTESTNKLNLMIKRHNKQMVEINNFAKTTSKILDAFYEMKEISQNERRNKLKEVITVINVTLDSSSNAESLNYLIGLKDKNHNDIVNAKIEKNEFKRVLSQEILDEIIEPKILIYKEKIEVSKLTVNDNVRGVESSSNSIIKRKKREQLKTYPLPEGFSQIDCSATKEEILAFFLILTKEKNNRNNEPFMISEDVTELVENNFKVFGESSTGRVFDINLLYRQKKSFTTFVYQFYDKYAALDGYKKMDYSNFLIWNFTNYKDDKRSSLESNMTPSKAAKGNDLIQIKSDLED